MVLAGWAGVVDLEPVSYACLMEDVFASARQRDEFLTGDIVRVAHYTSVIAVTQLRRALILELLASIEQMLIVFR